jgi:phage shock protein A
MSPRYLSTMSYLLAPSDEDTAAIRATLADYLVMMRMLDEIGQARGASANLVALHEQAYAAIRERTRLPARLVTLGLRDHASREAGAAIDSLPLDGRLYAIKSATHLSLATVEGRRLIPYSVAGYTAGWSDHAEARLLLTNDETLVLVGIASALKPRESAMATTEGIVSRIGRVIAGVAHGSVDAFEGANAVTTVEQSIREIDAVAEDARAGAGKARAEEHRLKAKIAEINDEIEDLFGKIETGLAEGREDLVKPVIGLQIDLEAQRAALESALAEAVEKIQESGKALQAVNLARQDAVARLAALKRSKGTADRAGEANASVRNDNRLSRSLDTIERVTGVSGRPTTGASEVEELARMQREAEIQQRLARYKGKRD